MGWVFLSQHHKLLIEINLTSENLARTVYFALKPELKTKIMISNTGIILHLETNSISSLRALANSYLRWTATILNIIDSVQINSM